MCYFGGRFLSMIALCNEGTKYQLFLKWGEFIGKWKTTEFRRNPARWSKLIQSIHNSCCQSDYYNIFEFHRKEKTNFPGNNYFPHNGCHKMAIRKCVVLF